MTAYRAAEPSPLGLDKRPKTTRQYVIVLVVGEVFLLAIRLSLHFWL